LVHPLHFSPFFIHFLWYFNRFKNSIFILYRKYINHIHFPYFLLLPSPFC
jgi:hypothetical protein